VCFCIGCLPTQELFCFKAWPLYVSKIIFHLSFCQLGKAGW
jgi:hypothetical protein